MSSPLLTIGIPFHNEARFLRAAIGSVLAQTFEDFELILIDDGSTDESLRIAREFLRESRVRVLSDGHRKRLPARLNEIVHVARGRFVARMDADDLSHPERLARQMMLFDEDSLLDVVGTWAALVAETGEIYGVVPLAPQEPLARAALLRGLLVHASIVGRRDWFLSHPYDERLSRAEDRDLWCRTFASSRFGVVSEPLYVVRVHPRAADYLEDYLESQRQNRTLFVRHGPALIGWGGTARAVLASFARSATMTVAASLNLTTAVVSRRGRPATPDENRVVHDALSAFSGEP